MKKIEKTLSQIEWLEDPVFSIPLSTYTSIRSGGIAAAVLQVCSPNELNTFLALSKSERIPWMILGKGSNVIFTGDGFKGVIVKLSGEFSRLNHGEKETNIIAGGGLSCFKFSRFLRNAGLSGAEFLSTIPGTLGGAIFMNAGAHGSEVQEILEWVEWVESDGEIKRTSKEHLKFSYRHSEFMDTERIILRAGFLLKKNDPKGIAAKEKYLHEQRKKTQPVHMPTWGSVFVNPEGDSAGRLIDSLGLKGKGFGDARISPMHGNFIENTGNASYQDLEKTILLARDAVWKEKGILLKTEVRIINPDGTPLVLPMP